ncbi:MAG TPA: squalene/phytoene synthase family protein [Thermoanaerobaculia bacterium]|nr:squalene/phytoene synthase family protein [Thermoanaerobaculia bacterium]HXK67989.1 squalene/phytoene synthase family protein [Thermoanaerobaculia bacterium]
MRTHTDSPLVSPALKAEFHRCRDITYRHGPNFSVGFRFLPTDKRYAVFSAYAFCRYADDLADEGNPVDEALLEACETELSRTYNGSPTHPITRALARTLTRYPIPREAFQGLIDGCRRDFTHKRYESFEELSIYCDLVAATISDISLAIFGPLDQEAYRLGKDLAYGLQLTNILRDVGEDVSRNRIYLPLDELRRFGVTEEDILNCRNSPEYRSLMVFQVERARNYFRRARSLPEHVEPDARFTVRLMAGVYESILEKIGKHPERSLQQETTLSFAEKVWIVFSSFIR